MKLLTFKNFIKQLIPPIFIDIKNLSNNKVIYRPFIFYNYADIKLSLENPWDNQKWLKHIEKKAKLVLKNSYKNHHINSLSDSINLIQFYKNNYEKKLFILDIGGGAGLYAAQLKNLYKESKYYKYICYDSESNINIGERLFNKENSIEFLATEKYNLIQLKELIPNNTNLIINISSTIQYIIDWKSFLIDIASFNAEVICISRLPLFPKAKRDAFSIQNISSSFGYCGSSIVNLLKKDSVSNLMNDLDYFNFSSNYIRNGDLSYYWGGNCPNEEYSVITDVASVFVKKSFRN